MQNTTKLPSGSEIINWVSYTRKEAHGVTVLVALSCVSLVAVVGLIVALSLSTFNSRKSLNRHVIVHNQISAYFVSLLLCNLLQAVASIMSAHWVNTMRVEVGSFCVAQGVLKQAADIGSAWWTMMIAIHSFYLLFLEWKLGRYVLWVNLIVGWGIVVAFVVGGPATLNQAERGPFYGITGYWCWISEEYTTERISLDYITMFVSSAVNFILYLLVFLRLRGNEAVAKWHRGLVGAKATNADREREYEDDQLLAIGRHMLLYPIAFTIMFIPIAIARFCSWIGHPAPLEFTIFSSSLFLLSGVVNVVLFITARPVLSRRSHRATIIDPTVITAPPTAIPRYSSSFESGPDPYYAPPDPHRSGYTPEDDPYYPKFDYAMHEPYFPNAVDKAAHDNEPPTPVFKRSASYESIEGMDAEETLPDGSHDSGAAERRPVPPVPALPAPAPLVPRRPPVIPRPVPPVPAVIEVPSRRASMESAYSVDSTCSPRLHDVPLSGRSRKGDHREGKGR